MLNFKHIGCATLAAAFAIALAIDAADARRGGGGGGMRAGGGFSGGGMRGGGGFSGGAIRSGGAARIGNAPGRPHVSPPIARPGPGGPGWSNRPGNRPPGWANRPGYNPGWGYRPGYGWGAAAAVGAGLAASTYYDPYYYGGYGYYDEGAYAAEADPIAECARRFKTYDPASQTYVVRKGVRARCP
jgi:hypothetical protein